MEQTHTERTGVPLMYETLEKLSESRGLDEVTPDLSLGPVLRGNVSSSVVRNTVAPEQRTNTSHCSSLRRIENVLLFTQTRTPCGGTATC